MRNIVILFVAAMLMGCYGTDRVDGDPIECSTDCDDGDPCTSDVCDSVAECQHFAIPDCLECDEDSDCMDEDPCTIGSCESGACVQTPSEDPLCSPSCESHLDCDDGDLCTMDVCGFDGACVHDQIDRVLIFFDEDGDGFGGVDSTSTSLHCPATEMPPGYVTNGDDCNDHRADIHPGAEEVCDLIHDNDCDGEIDEGVCEHNCPGESGFCPFEDGVPEGQVAIGLELIYSCVPESPTLWYMESPDEYLLSFATTNLEPGDTIERLAVHQTRGETPIPISGGPAGIVAILWAHGVRDGMSVDAFLGNVAQEDDGGFVFENITMPEIDNPYLKVRIYIGLYSGEVQFGLLNLNDLRVAGKTTTSERCTPEPQLGPHYFSVCPDHDRDDYEADWCGGSDDNDWDPFVH
ncbi:MAG: putative metal-binding motif-containing protein [Patescibacteria group bacterium]|nr:putative metal-binding motif-containing protein [Patescibacteria group bacterium]